jgi:hypothetical protein
MFITPGNGATPGDGWAAGEPRAWKLRKPRGRVPKV